MKLSEMTEQQLSDVMIRSAKSVKSVLGEKSMFVLICFDDPKVGQYISTCERSTTIEALRETANRLERNQDIPR